VIGRLVPLALLLAVAACGGPPPVPPPAPTPSGPPCPAGGVDIAAEGGEAAMGLRVLKLRMRNCGATPYPVSGYPDLELLDEDGQVLDVEVQRGSTGISRVDWFEAPPREVTLQPGDTATSGLVWRNTYDDTTEPPQVGTRIAVAPVAGRPRLTFRPEPAGAGGTATPTTIDLGSTGVVGVRAWTTP